MESIMEMEVLMSVCLGLGLSAACGFRIFVPMLVISAASNAGHLELASGFEWMGTTPALLTFAAATFAEVGAYYMPWLDNMLDTIAAPTAVTAGVVATASQVSDVSPLMGWTIAVIGGGGVAGAVQGLTTAARQFSLFATGGFANPIVSTLEGGASVFVAMLAITVPIFTLMVMLLVSFWAVRWILRRRAQTTQTPPPAPAGA